MQVNTNNLEFEMRRDNVLKALVLRGHLTDDGYNWLLNALDPFADVVRTPSGYPDPDDSLSVVRAHRESVVVTKPAAAAANWDCVMFTMPIITSSAGWASSMAITDAVSNVAYQSTPPTALDIAPVMIHAADSGQALIPDGTIAGWTPTNFQQSLLGNAQNIGVAGRIIAQAIECHNTTAKVSLQGDLTAVSYKQEVHQTTAYCTDDDAANAVQYIPVNHCTMPPKTVAAAEEAPHVRVWKAKDGFYAVNTLHGIDNDYSRLKHGELLATNGGAWNQETGIMSLIIADYQCHNFRTSNTNGLCIFMSGLSNATTLKFTIRSLIELAPVPGDGTGLVALAEKSAAHDPLALTLYSHLVNELPIAVPVDHNNAGDWFRAILNAASYILPVLGGALTPIFAPAAAIGAAAGAAASAAAKQIPKKKKKKKKINKKVTRPTRIAPPGRVRAKN